MIKHMKQKQSDNKKLYVVIMSVRSRHIPESRCVKGQNEL